MKNQKSDGQVELALQVPTDILTENRAGKTAGRASEPPSVHSVLSHPETIPAHATLPALPVSSLLHSGKIISPAVPLRKRSADFPAVWRGGVPTEREASATPFRPNLDAEQLFHAVALKDASRPFVVLQGPRSSGSFGIVTGAAVMVAEPKLRAGEKTLVVMLYGTTADREEFRHSLASINLPKGFEVKEINSVYDYHRANHAGLILTTVEELAKLSATNTTVGGRVAAVVVPHSHRSGMGIDWDVFESWLQQYPLSTKGTRVFVESNQPQQNELKLVNFSLRHPRETAVLPTSGSNDPVHKFAAVCLWREMSAQGGFLSQGNAALDGITAQAQLLKSAIHRGLSRVHFQQAKDEITFEIPKDIDDRGILSFAGDARHFANKMFMARRAGKLSADPVLLSTIESLSHEFSALTTHGLHLQSHGVATFALGLAIEVLAYATDKKDRDQYPARIYGNEWNRVGSQEYAASVLELERLSYSPSSGPLKAAAEFIAAKSPVFAEMLGSINTIGSKFQNARDRRHYIRDLRAELAELVGREPDSPKAWVLHDTLKPLFRGEINERVVIVTETDDHARFVEASLNAANKSNPGLGIFRLRHPDVASNHETAAAAECSRSVVILSGKTPVSSTLSFDHGIVLDPLVDSKLMDSVRAGLLNTSGTKEMLTILCGSADVKNYLRNPHRIYHR